MQRELSWLPMKSHSSARLRSMSCGLQSVVLRTRLNFAVAPEVETLIFRLWQVSTWDLP